MNIELERSLISLINKLKVKNRKLYQKIVYIELCTSDSKIELVKEFNTNLKKINLLENKCNL